MTTMGHSISNALRLCSLLLLATSALSHSYHTGSCPVIQGMPHFQVDKFLGEWYVLQKTQSSARCLINNFTRDANSENQLLLEQSSAHAVLGLTAKDGRYRYNGVLSPKENHTTLGEMVVRFKLNVAGSASYVVVTTDYNGHAAIVSCQDLPLGAGHRLSASILGRTRKLHPGTMEKVRHILSTDGIDVDSMNDLEQDVEACKPPVPGEGFHGAVQRAGEVLGSGVQAIKDGAKKLYEKVRGQDSSEESGEATTAKPGQTKGALGSNSDKDAEWLP